MLHFFSQWLRLLGDYLVGFLMFVFTLHVIVMEVYYFTFFFSLRLESTVVRKFWSTVWASSSLKK